MQLQLRRLTQSRLAVVLIIIVILIVVGAAVYLLLQPHSGETRRTTTQTTQTALPTTKTTTSLSFTTTKNTTNQSSTITSTSTTTITNTTKTTQTTTTLSKHVDFGAKIYSLSYAQIGKATWPLVEQELTMLQRMGVQEYSIHLNYDPWLKKQADKIAIVDQTVNWIRANNGTLHLVDAGAESLRQNPVSWDEFKALFQTRIADWTQRYHPEVLTVVKEPGYYVPFIRNGENVDPSDFTSLAIELDATVKSISPNTRIVYAENARPLIDGGIAVQMLNSMLKDPNLDIVGLDIYGYQCGEDNKTPQLNSTIASVKDAGKIVWITEAWATTEKGMSSCTDLSAAEIAWAQYISEYAVREQIPVVEWFFTQRFGNSTDPSPTYLGIQRVMEQFR